MLSRIPNASQGLVAPLQPVGSAYTTLRILSYNIQAGIPTQRALDYFLKSWQYILPSSDSSKNNLNQIAKVLSEFDLVALQEVDCGSLRSGFINQLEYLAEQSGIPFWHSQVNRNLGKFGRMCNGILSRIQPSFITNHRLPGLIPGRGAIMLQFGDTETPFIFVNLHLALGAKARALQLDYLRELVQDYQYVVVLGDMNCPSEAEEMRSLLLHTDLRPINTSLNTFPSWSPKRCIDQILVSPSLQVASIQTIPVPFSDHLPIAVEITIPSNLLMI